MYTGITAGLRQSLLEDCDYVALIIHMKRGRNSEERKHRAGESSSHPVYLLTSALVCLPLPRVAEKESINKMSLHNLATVFGPTLLRPSEKDSKIPANPTQPISMGDSWSLEVMAQVSHTRLLLAFCL